ncbi:site-specific integrase [Formosa haliotis]|uniref:site-specific integrase n=1 Tax=Formosa haliotis TaxID=1555194 RepID=UPI000826CB00|nr:site-specific integrase [Formosa haliotis]
MKTTKSFSVNFWLKKRSIKSNGQIPIYARILVNGIGADISVQRTTLESNWCYQSFRVKPRLKDAKSINDFLDGIYTDLLECHKQLCSEGVPISSQRIKKRYLGKDKVMETLDDILEYHRTVESKKLTPGTLKNYTATEKYLKRFIKQKYGGSDIQLPFIDYLFVIKFEDFLRTCKPLRASQSLNNNGVMKHMERLKKLINIAMKFGGYKCSPFSFYAFKYEDYDSVFLESWELERLKSVSLPSVLLKQIRDFFVFSCYTGLSYVEVKQLRNNDIVEGIDGALWINVKRQKTKTPVRVPLLPQALEILYRYSCYGNQNNGFRLFPIISNQKVNDNIKILAKIAGISKHLTFHVARHTFATTITLLNDVPLETVSKLLGHTKLSTTQKYARVVEKKISKDMGRLKQVLIENEKKNKIKKSSFEPVPLRIV